MMALFVVVFMLLGLSVRGLVPPLTEDEKSLLKQEDKISVPLSIHTRVGFKSVYVDHGGNIHTSPTSLPTILVQGTMMVSDEAIMKAATTVAYMIQHAPYDVFMGVTRSHGVGLFTKQETLTVYPENSNMADTPACHGRCSGSCSVTCTFDGRKYQEIAGVTNSRSVVLDDTVMCNVYDPYRQSLNVVSHEFAHLIHKYLPPTYSNRIHYAYSKAKQQHTWENSYATDTPYEYFAEAATAFFMTSERSEAAGGMNLCNQVLCRNEMDARIHLQATDPDLFDILQQVYTSGHPSIPSFLRTCM